MDNRTAPSGGSRRPQPPVGALERPPSGGPSGAGGDGIQDPGVVRKDPVGAASGDMAVDKDRGICEAVRTTGIIYLLSLLY